MAVRALFGLDLAALTQLVGELGQKPYRARQLFDSLYKQRVTSLDQVTTLSQELRLRLAEKDWSIGLPVLAQTAVSVDGTERYLVRMSDSETVEAVWMPDGDGADAEPEDEAAGDLSGELALAAQAMGEIPLLQRTPLQATRDGADRARGTRPRLGALAERGYRRATICISSQVGCAVNCQFCLTAKLGIRRNLTAGEIAGQVVAVLNRHGIVVGQDRINLVFMGMGEPFLNYDDFMAAVRLLVGGVGIPESRMTVSTSGILPGIERFATETVRPRLALSLNASNDRVRETVMPITRKWKIGDLLDACRQIPLRTREWVTFEYVLLGGVNDRLEHAQEVLDLLRGMRAKVNLIVWNPGPGIAYKEPEPEAVSLFQHYLMDGGIATYIRRPRGRDIYAACGQLKRTANEEAGQDLVAIAAAS